MTPTLRHHVRDRAERDRSSAPLLAGGLAAVAAACSGDSEAAADDARRRPSPRRPRRRRRPRDDRRPPPTATDHDGRADDDGGADHDHRGRSIPRMPLTGAAARRTARSPPDRPALVVKIDNNPGARPQSGLNAADIVFEEIVEVGTRFAAVFHSGSANPVGPIRSGRTQDVDLLGGLQPAAVRLERRQRRRHPGDRRLRLHRPQPDSAARRCTAARAATARRTTSTPTPTRCGRWRPPEAGRPTPLFAYLAPGRGAGGRPASRAPRSGWTATACAWECDAGDRRATGARRTAGRTTTAPTASRSTRPTSSSSRRRTGRASSTAAARRRSRSAAAGAVRVHRRQMRRRARGCATHRADGIALFDADGAAIELHAGPDVGRAGRSRRRHARRSS